MFEEASIISGEVLTKTLAPNTLDLINKVKTRDLDCLILKGMPFSIGEHIDTPLTDSVPDKEDWFSEYNLLGISNILNAVPYLNKEEKDGSIIQQVIPLENKETTASGGGFKSSFFSHTENVHDPNPPDLFILFCLSGNENALTTFVSIDQLIDTLPKWVIEGMKKPDFLFRTGPSYNTVLELRDSIIKVDSDGQFTIKYNANEGRVLACNSNAKKVLEYLNKYLKDINNLNFVSLDQGDCLIMDNKRILHGRTSFEDDVKSPQKRWLQRIYLHRK